MTGSASEQEWASPYGGAFVPNDALAVSDEAAASSFAGRAPDEPPPVPQGTPHVVVQFERARCLLPLGDLRGVLTETPKLVRFPFSRPWLLGVFLLRAELIAVVDPLPVLFGRTGYSADDATSSPETASHISASDERPTILVGSDERTLGFRTDGVFEVVFVSESGGSPSVEMPSERYAPIESRYIEAFWASEPGTPAIPILAIQPLLDDLLRSVSEEGRDG